MAAVDFSRVTKRFGTTTAVDGLDLSIEDGATLAPGDTFTLIIDGQPLKFSGTGGANMRKPYKDQHEREVADDS